MRLALALGVALLPEAAVAKKKPAFGVFATINGTKFKAPSTGKATDPCVNGFYQASGGIVFTAGECRGRRRRVPSKNYKVLVFACGVLNPPPPTPPFQAPCLTAGYTEARTKRGAPVSMKEWGSSANFVIGPGGTLVLQSGVNIRIDSFDGTYVRGAFSGSFDMPLVGATGPAPISGEGTFYFPVKGIE
jgi:hypothetical protein